MLYLFVSITPYADSTRILLFEHGSSRSALAPARWACLSSRWGGTSRRPDRPTRPMLPPPPSACRVSVASLPPASKTLRFAPARSPLAYSTIAECASLSPSPPSAVPSRFVEKHVSFQGYETLLSKSWQTRAATGRDSDAAKGLFWV